MVALRDEIGEARLEDVPALVAQMERLQGVSLTRGDLQTMLVDPAAPYFGHLRLREEVAGRGAVERDVFIGRATFVDAAARVNIVDWRHAPVSQLFYRYAEGSDYEEQFGDRDVSGEIVARRILTIEGGVLVRVACPQGVWARRPRVTGAATRRLAAHRPADARARGRPGDGGASGARRAGRRARRPAGAGPPPPRDRGAARPAPVRRHHRARRRGGRHPGRRRQRQDDGRPAPARVPGAHVPASASRRGAWRSSRTARRWRRTSASCCRRWASGACASTTFMRAGRARAAPRAARGCAPPSSTMRPPAVTRVKSHPALLHELTRLAAAYRGKRTSRAAVELWADLLTDRARLLALVRDAAEMPVSERDVLEAHRAMTDRVAAVVARDPREGGAEAAAAKKVGAYRRGQAAAQAGRAAGPTCTGRRWAWRRSWAREPSTAICPRAYAGSRATSTTRATATMTRTTTRTCAARPASTACPPTTTCPCWTPTTSPSCCAPTSCCAARGGRLRTCSWTRRRICRR